MATDLTTRLSPAELDRLVLNANAVIRECDGGVHIVLPHFGHKLQASRRLSAILSAFRDRNLVEIADCVDRDVIDFLRDHYLLLDEAASFALLGGLTGQVVPEVGRFYAPRQISEIPSGSTCIFGVPIDTAVLPPFSPAHGPSCIRRELERTGSIFGRSDIVDLGDIVWWPDDGLNVVGARVQHLIERLLGAGCFPILLGGDHSVSYYSLRTISARGEPFGILHLDAHDDLGRHPGSVEYPSPLNHANVMGHILELPGLVRLVQVGVRNPPDPVWSRSQSTAAVLCNVSPQQFRRIGQEAVLDLLPDVPIYLTVDLDVIDPQEAPEVTTPLTGGLGRAEVQSFVRAVASHHPILAADMVEVCATGGGRNNAAQIAAELISLIISRRRKDNV